MLRRSDEDAELDLAEQLVKNRVRASLLGEARAPVRLGRFEILRCLGRGGYGAVYEAREDGSTTSLALKVLHHRGAGPRSDLRREFRAAQQLVHPNLVSLYELFAHDERPFFTMELVRGHGILAQLARREASGAAIRSVFRALLDAVATIHAQDKVHRDLKPSNVLLSDEGRTVVLDYGLMIDETATWHAQRGESGTRSYMAPELRRGRAVDAKADVYAVGKMLSEALEAAGL